MMPVLLSICICSVLRGGDANECVTQGKSYMFNGTLSGIRQAYQTFDDCLKGIGCTNCSGSRELKFLHSLTGTAMLLIRDDGGSVSSVLELAGRFGLKLSGDSVNLGELSINYPTNARDSYQIPPSAPDANEIRNIINTSMIPQIQAIIDELNSINDSPSDRFRIFFGPGETGLENNLEVDYAEVLLLKGLLTALKGQLEAQQAYDIFLDANDMLIEKVYGDCFNINNDLLNPHPGLLKVLPTPEHPQNGKTALSQAKTDLINGINYYFDMVSYIRSEEDPQTDDFLYIDPNDEGILDRISDQLTTLRDSLEQDKSGTYPWQTTRIYRLQDANSTEWTLTLKYDLGSFIQSTPTGGSFAASSSEGMPSPWEILYSNVDGNEISIGLEYQQSDHWGNGWLSATMSPDGNNITNGSFEYWGWPDSGTIYNLSGPLISTETLEKQMDPNPIFGSSERFPNPVNPRDLLPQLDKWNSPLPNTVGKGLGNDATLGGILPGMTQYDWQLNFGLEPGGLFYLQEIYPWQKDRDGFVYLWLNKHMVFSDISGDTENEDNVTGNIDISKLYMGYDDAYLYGALTFNDSNSWNQDRTYNLDMSYQPQDNESLDSIRLQISVNGGTATASIAQMVDSYGYRHWETVPFYPSAKATGNGVNFTIPWSYLPGYLPGRFISLAADGHDNTWYYWNSDDDYTHLQIGELGCISGTVAWDGWKGAPIFVQAYTDVNNPEDSIVAATMITEPGPYTLEGIGLGWEGYIKAFTPVFGFDNVFELGAFDIESTTSVFLWLEDLEDVDLVLHSPVILEKDVWVPDEIDAQTRQKNWYAFNAIAGGTYTLDLVRDTAAYANLDLYGRDGRTLLDRRFYWQFQQIVWICPATGRYYIKVANDSSQSGGGTYQIQMTTDITCPQADIAGAEGIGIPDCRVDFYDLAALVSYWIQSCSGPGWCDNADIDRSGIVNFRDFTILAGQWME